MTDWGYGDWQTWSPYDGHPNDPRAPMWDDDEEEEDEDGLL